MRLRHGKKGIALRLFDLEAEIMDVVWSRKLAEFTVADVHAVLERKREIAYTTVMTTLSRLYEKGIVDRQRDGKRHVYSPRFTREQLLQTTARDVLRGLSGASGHTALAMLAETVSTADEAALDELEQLIRRRRKELR